MIEKELIIKLRTIDGTILTNSLIRTKAKEVALAQNIPDEKFKASSSWVAGFKCRAGIQHGIMTEVEVHAALEYEDSTPDGVNFL